MATIKSFTDLQQSKKLAEILPLESADMYYSYYHNPISGASYYEEYPIFHMPINKNKSLPCWNLSALLGVLPGVHLKKYIYDGITKYYATLTGLRQFNSKHYDNPVDACVEMIIKLKKDGLL